MRIRALKPGFFKNEELAELSAWHRLAFAGLWCCGDKEGRLEDRPKRLKVEIFPYDDLDLNALMWDLARAGFIRRYSIRSRPLVDIPTWSEHQHPRPDEAESELAAYEDGADRVNGPDTTTYPALQAIDTLPSLSSDAVVSPARMGSGKWEVGDGKLEVGNAASPLGPCRAQDLMDLWNATTKPPIPRCRELTEDRRRKIRARLAKRPLLTQWREAFEALQTVPFYVGKNDRGWVADFDYAIKNDTVIAKILERVETPKQPTAQHGWACPHDEPKCTARNACHVREQILDAKRQAS